MGPAGGRFYGRVGAGPVPQGITVQALQSDPEMLSDFMSLPRQQRALIISESPDLYASSPEMFDALLGGDEMPVTAVSAQDAGARFLSEPGVTGEPTLVASTTLENLPSGVKLTPGQRGKVHLSAIESAGTIAEGANLIRKIRSYEDDAFGPTFAAAQWVTPLLSLVSNELANWASGKLTGLSEQEMAALAVEANALNAQSIEIITGEEGARKSDAELAITKKATRITAPYTDRNLVLGAVEAIVAKHYINWDRKRVTLGQPLKYDLGTRDGLRGQANEFLNLGFSVETAGQMLRVMKDQRDYLNETGANLNYGTEE